MSGKEKSMTQISGTAFLHDSILRSELAGLISRGRKTRESQNFIRRRKASEVADFRFNGGGETKTDTRNRFKRGVKFLHVRLNPLFNLGNFFVQNLNELDGVAKFQDFGGNINADGFARQIANFLSLIVADLPARGTFQKINQRMATSLALGYFSNMA